MKPLPLTLQTEAVRLCEQAADALEWVARRESVACNVPMGGTRLETLKSLNRFLEKVEQGFTDNPAGACGSQALGPPLSKISLDNSASAEEVL